jgi:hypothetical protein
MNKREKEARKLPEHVEPLLPWHAAGMLSRHDTARVGQALANDNGFSAHCELVREELGKALRLNEAAGARSERTRLLVVVGSPAITGAYRLKQYGLSKWYKFQHRN